MFYILNKECTILCKVFVLNILADYKAMKSGIDLTQLDLIKHLFLLMLSARNVFLTINTKIAGVCLSILIIFVNNFE